MSWADSRSRQRPSPIRAAWPVASTMSVKRIVSSRRCRPLVDVRLPVRNSSISPSSASVSPTIGRLSIAGQLDQPRAGDPLRGQPRVADVDQPIAGAVQDQRRHAQRRQVVAHVDVAQVGGHAQHAGGVVADWRSSLPDPLRGSARRRRRSAPCRRGWRRCPSAPAGASRRSSRASGESAKGDLVVALGRQDRGVEDQRERAVRARRGVLDRQRAAGRVGLHDDAVAAGGVEHRVDVGDLVGQRTAGRRAGPTRPRPRRSTRITRAIEPSRSHQRRRPGSSSSTSMCDKKPPRKTRSTGPSPSTRKAMCDSPLCAQRTRPSSMRPA